MRKPKQPRELRSEYTRRDFLQPFVRGKYAGKIYDDSNVVLLDPEVAKVFPNSKSINDALKSLIRIAKRSGQAK